MGRREERGDLMTNWVDRGNERDGEAIGCLSGFYLGGWMDGNANDWYRGFRGTGFRRRVLSSFILHQSIVRTIFYY